MPRKRLAPPFARRPLLCLATLGLGACTSLPPAPPPALDVPAHFKQAVNFAPVDLQAADVPEAWWTLYADPVLDGLLARLPQGSATLQAAAAAVAGAQAALASSRAALSPTLGLNLGAARSASASAAPASSYTAQGLLSGWEIDLWNRIGATVDAAGARLQASEATLAATRLSQQATLVQTYFALRASESLGRLLAQTVRGYTRSLELTRHRYQGGVASAADVAQAETQLASTQVQQREAALQRTQLEHALAVLLGLPPAAFDLAATDAALPNPPAVPVQLPAALLQRRPDIAAAARQVAAANAQRGAAAAAFFPALTLSANGGFRSSDLGGLLQSGQRLWSLGPGLLFNVFDAGARQGASDTARASHDQAVANYRQTVLAALQEVEDNLAAAAALAQEVALQQTSVAAARRALDITQNQYQAGTVSYLAVVSAQTTALNAEQTLLTLRNRRLGAVNQLLKNLGGRWAPG